MEFDFTPQEDLTKVPEAFRGMYNTEANEEGKYTVNESLAPVSAAVLGLNKALKAARTEAKTKAVDLSPLSEYGDSPEAIKETIEAKLNDIMSKDENAKVNIDKIKKDLAEGHSKELTKQQERTEALKNQLYTMLVQNEATTAITEAKGVTELLLPYVKQQVQVKEEDGKFEAFVVDAQGDVRYSGVTGQPMSIRELVAELKATEKLGRAFESDTQSGGGGMTPNSGRRTPNVAADKTSVDKIAAGLNKNNYR